MLPHSAARTSPDTGAKREQVDVLIVGARIAGASLALLLAQRGRRVLMVDRDQFPSDCLSTHYMIPRYVGLLAQLGVLHDVEAAGFRRITRSRTWVADCMLEGPVAPAGGYAFAPRRDALDAILIEHAVGHGVEFWERTRAAELVEEDGRVVGAVVVPHQGEARHVRAGVVVGADGRHSKVAEWVDAPRYDETPGLRPAYYGYFRGLEPLDEPALEMFFVDNRIGFVFPMQPGVDCLELELQPDDFQSFRSKPREHFEEHFRRLPTMQRRMANVELEGQMQGMHSIANFFRKPYGPGWALTGDAAYLKDLITGSGMGDALAQAFLLAPALDVALGGEADWEAKMAAYQQERDAQLRGQLQFTVSVAQERDPTPEQLAWLRAALSVPHIARTMTRVLPSALPDAMPAVQQPLLKLLTQAYGSAPSQAVATAADD